MSILEAGCIADYREYFDEGLALLQFGFAPESLAAGAAPPAPG